MKKSGFRTIFHVYLILFLTIMGAVLAVAGFFAFLITVEKPDGSTARSDWPNELTESFGEQIIFIDDLPQISQSGLELLQREGIGLQVLDRSGSQVLGFQEPKGAAADYTAGELLRLCGTGGLEDGPGSAFAGTVFHGGDEYTYLLHFPVNISRVTMYLNGERFTGGKPVLLTVAAALVFAALAAGLAYGFWTAGEMRRLTAAISDVAGRRYMPVKNRGVFRDLYESLNTLDEEVRESDKLRERTERQRREWIANLTHDLKTPLSPIKGYAEIMLEDGSVNGERRGRYAEIIRKNAAYMETLVDDLKLAYQLENDMVPMERQEQDLVRFLRELAIDILNTPDFEGRVIHFECDRETIPFSFDRTLFTRAFRNLVINAFVHGEARTEVTLSASAADSGVKIAVADNGKGMTREELERLFDRYYRGTGASQRPEGTGLGLAIVKHIIELHGGSISVFSRPGRGTVFEIALPAA